jgi:hypothetical protein
LQVLPGFGMLRRMFGTSAGFSRIVTCAVFALVGGCAYGEMRDVLRAQVASESQCVELSVHKTAAFRQGYQENQYEVKGCGVERVYTCKQSGLVAYGHAECTYVATNAPKPPAPAPVSTDDSDLPPPASDDSAPGDAP